MIFVDSGAWIAFLNQTDQHHKDALAIYNGFKEGESAASNDRLCN